MEQDAYPDLEPSGKVDIEDDTSVVYSASGKAERSNPDLASSPAAKRRKLDDAHPGESDEDFVDELAPAKLEAVEEFAEEIRQEPQGEQSDNDGGGGGGDDEMAQPGQRESYELFDPDLQSNPAADLKRLAQQRAKETAESLYPAAGKHVDFIERKINRARSKRVPVRMMGYPQGEPRSVLATTARYGSGVKSTRDSYLSDALNEHIRHRDDVFMGSLDQTDTVGLSELLVFSAEVNKGVAKLVTDSVHNTEIFIRAIPDVIQPNESDVKGPAAGGEGAAAQLPQEVPTALNAACLLKERETITRDSLKSLLMYGFVVFAVKRGLDSAVIDLLGKSEVFKTVPGPRNSKDALLHTHVQDTHSSRARSHHISDAHLLQCHVIQPWMGILSCYRCQETSTLKFHFTATHEFARAYVGQGYIMKVYIPQRELNVFAPTVAPVTDEIRGFDDLAFSARQSDRGSNSLNAEKRIMINSPLERIKSEWAVYQTRLSYYDQVMGYNAYPVIFRSTSVDTTALNHLTGSAIAQNASQKVAASSATESDGNRLLQGSQMLVTQPTFQTSQYIADEKKRQIMNRFSESTGFAPSSMTNASYELHQRGSAVSDRIMMSGEGVRDRMRADGRPGPTDIITKSAANMKDTNPRFLSQRRAASFAVPSRAADRLKDAHDWPPPEQTITNVHAATYSGPSPDDMKKAFEEVVIRELKVPPNIFRSEATASSEKEMFSTMAPQISTRNANALEYEMEASGYGDTIEGIKNTLTDMWEFLYAEVIWEFDSVILEKLFAKELRRLNATHDQVVKIITDYELGLLKAEAQQAQARQQTKGGQKSAPKRPERGSLVDPLQKTAEILKLLRTTSNKLSRDAYLRHLQMMTLYLTAIKSNVYLSVEFRASARSVEKMQMRQKAAQMRLKAEGFGDDDDDDDKKEASDKGERKGKSKKKQGKSKGKKRAREADDEKKGSKAADTEVVQALARALASILEEKKPGKTDKDAKRKK